ncbi:CotG/ExsB N-terminal domain-containing protein, partial [Neobacillus drentensis]|uniref:CotG/ExsB N-terminal domain-containing protein n=1 Tax=Neobacillus drentensis TaxID=220684 RepID=UPI003B588CBE
MFSLNGYSALEIQEAIKEAEKIGLGDFMHQSPYSRRTGRGKGRSTGRGTG